ncbi:MAG TPA: hypothetical protein DCE42_17355 [Myxococcales bacterium]|nr:hypothetical protein [Deltaproteobacteria bacterium]HAA56537.1 hypothetical protein [Myxococcales bacterium]
MNCAQLDKRLSEPGAVPTMEEMEHIQACATCKKRHGFGALLSFHSSTQNINSAPGEDLFFARLEHLSQQQDNTFQRAQTLHEKVQDGDRLFWKGDYDACIEVYQDALMLVRDSQGRVALLNKLGRAQMHRYHYKDAITMLNDALEELEEPIPPQEDDLSWALFTERLQLWWLQIATTLRQQAPKLLPQTTIYGDRSRTAQHIYRELSILSQGHDEKLSEWAQLRELQWALKLEQPLEKIVAWGRLAVRHASKQQTQQTKQCIRRIEELTTQLDEPICQAAAAFYTGRSAYLLGDSDRARIQLEQTVAQCEQSKDECLREAALQHLIRIYRHDGNYTEALRIANELLKLHHNTGNLPRLSACCRHFAMIYASYGDLRYARAWALRAIHVFEDKDIPQQDHKLSLLRCNILLANIEYRGGQSEAARRYIGEAIRIQREHDLPAPFIQDGVALLRQILGKEEPQKHSLFSTLWRWIRGENKLGEQNPAQVPEDIAYIYQENTTTSRSHGLRETIPPSSFALSFLQDTLTPAQTPDSHSQDLLMPVGAVSSRWGRGSLSKDRTGVITTQFSNAPEAPWGYFFADDIG